MNERSISARLRRGIIKKGYHVLVSESICKGFPDLLIATNRKTYFIELKVADSNEGHEKLFSKMQLFWLSRLPLAFGLVFVKARDSILYAIDQDYSLRKVATIENVEGLLNFIEIV